MYFKTLRRMLLIGATAAALALPGVATAAIDHSGHRYNQPEQAEQQDGGGVQIDFVPPVLSGLSAEECRYFEQNIPEYDCQMTLAQWAAFDDDQVVSGPPPGVDYKFWEENHWEFADGRSTFAWITQEPVTDTDLSSLEDGIPDY